MIFSPRNLVPTGKSPSPTNAAAARLHLVADLLSQHLVSGADAEHARPALAPGLLADPGREAGSPQPVQIIDGGLGAGQDDQIGVAQLAR